TRLGLALDVEGQDVFPAPRFTLPHQEHAVRGHAPGQDQLGGLQARQRPVEPLSLAQGVLHLPHTPSRIEAHLSHTHTHTHPHPLKPISHTHTHTHTLTH